MLRYASPSGMALPIPTGWQSHFWPRRGSASGGLPMVALFEQGQVVVEELVGQLGKATLEAVLAISAESA